MNQAFVISPRIIAHLGEELIRNESIAILELVKNSYDACATTCQVDFHQGFFTNIDEIVIEDDGKGMSIDTVRNVWLVIGTDNKQGVDKPNEMGRYPLGEKGIGRLGVHKLGKNVRMLTKAEGHDEVEVILNWEELNKVDTIEDFKVIVRENPVPTHFTDSTGTRIEITALKNEWTRRRLREVYRSLSSLSSPFANNNDSFKAIVTSNDATLFRGLPNLQEILDTGMYVGHCKMLDNRIVDFRYEFRPWKSLDKMHSGRIVTLEELKNEDLILKSISEKKNRHVVDFVPINLKDYNIGPVELDIIIYERDSSVLNYMEIEKTTVADYLRENGGVRVYRDNMRVYDYGERDNDWLGIDIQRIRRFGGTISNNLIIGAVQLKRNESHGLREKTNREGFIEDDAYQVFNSAVNYALSLIVRHRNDDREKLMTLYKKHKAVEPVLSDLQDAIQIVETTMPSGGDKENLLNILNRVDGQYRNVKEVLIKSANAGLNLGAIVHEVEKQVSALIGCAERNEGERVKEISLRLEQIIKKYSVILRKTDLHQASLAQIVSKAVEYYEFRFMDHNIRVLDNYMFSPLTAYLSDAETISAIINIFDNSIFWLGYARTPFAMIDIFITDQIDGYHSIVIGDNGPGFNISADAAVKPFVSGKPFNYGMGLGLHVVNETMNELHGKLLILDKDEIELPDYMEQNRTYSALIALCFPKIKP